MSSFIFVPEMTDPSEPGVTRVTVVDAESGKTVEFGLPIGEALLQYAENESELIPLNLPADYLAVLVQAVSDQFTRLGDDPAYQPWLEHVRQGADPDRHPLATRSGYEAIVLRLHGLLERSQPQEPPA